MEQDQIFYIKIKDGDPVGYPFLLDNLKQCGISPENSSDWSQFFQLTEPKPQVQQTEVAEIITTFDGKVTKQSWLVRAKTQEEIESSTNPLDKIPGSAPNVI